MAISGLSSVVFGRWFDASGFKVMFAGFLTGTFAAPLLFLGGFLPALAGTLLWGTGLGVQGSVLSAAVAEMVPAHARASAFGIFTAVFGVAWFLGSTALGALYDVSRPWLVVVSVVPQLVALIPLFLALRAIGRP
jgi:predicted MFS family arabinose efflux permease